MTRKPKGRGERLAGRPGAPSHSPPSQEYILNSSLSYMRVFESMGHGSISMQVFVTVRAGLEIKPTFTDRQAVHEEFRLSSIWNHSRS
jgi:hypothetical protein